MKLLKKLKILFIIIFFISIFLANKSFAVTGTITEITVNMRKEPSTDSKKIMYVTQDDKVEVLEKVGEWYKIKAQGKTGYVFGKYIKVDDSKLEKKEEITTSNKDKEEATNNKETQEVEKVQDINSNLIIKKKTQIRIVPNISSSVIYTPSKDISVNIIEQINDWTYVSVGSVLGWVRTDKIVEENEVLPDKKEENKEEIKEDSETKEDKKETSKKEETKKEEATKTEKKETKIAYIKYDTVNLREKASTSAKVLAKLKINDEVKVIEKINTVWSKVEADGKTGYISTSLLADKKQEVKETEKKEEKDETTSRDSETTSREEQKTTQTITKKEEDKQTNSSKVTGDDIVAYAKKFLGYNYVYGGASPKTGFDCSGLTYYVYKHFGYTLSRSSKLQAKNGTEVSKANLKPGDLLIYKNKSLTAIGHVGIYIGDGKMIHASEPGVGVVITSIDSAAHKYPQRYVTARRIIK